jgi:predicted RNase H-like nuclease (RuvC/YqgF family)
MADKKGAKGVGKESVAQLRGELKAIQLSHANLQAEMKRAVRFFTFLNPARLLIKKLPDLSFETYKRYAVECNIQAGDVLLIENIEGVSKQALELMRGTVSTLICRGNPASLKGFALLDPAGLKLIEWGRFAIVEKRELEAALRRG